MRTTRRWIVIAFLAIATIMASVFGAASATAAPYDPGTSTTLTVTRSVIPQGDTTTVIGTNFTANVSGTLTLHSTPVGVGPFHTDDFGDFRQEITIPADTEPGAHYIEATDAAGVTHNVDITVTTQGGSSSPIPSGSGTGSSSGSGGGLAGTGVAVIGVGSIGVVLLIGGALMLLASRRRKGTHA